MCFHFSQPSPHLCWPPQSHRKVLTVRRHPSDLSPAAPGRLARTTWDWAHFPALIIPVCSAGTGPCRSGLRRLLFHLFPHLFSLSTLPERSIPPRSRLWQRRSARMTSVVPICVTTRAWSHQAFPQAPERLNFMRANA